MQATTVLGAATLAALGLFYLAPSLVAARRAPNAVPRVLQVNVFLGWTGVAWLYCWWVALRPPAPAPASVSAQGPVAGLPVSDRLPGWVSDLARDERAWRALPRDTAPVRPLYRPEGR